MKKWETLIVNHTIFYLDNVKSGVGLRYLAIYMRSGKLTGFIASNWNYVNLTQPTGNLTLSSYWIWRIISAKCPWCIKTRQIVKRWQRYSYIFDFFVSEYLFRDRVSIFLSERARICHSSEGWNPVILSIHRISPSIQTYCIFVSLWIPAFAGMTRERPAALKFLDYSADIIKSTTPSSSDHHILWRGMEWISSDFPLCT